MSSNYDFDTQSVVYSLLAGEIERFKSFVHDRIELFYRSYDVRKSMDQSKIVELISCVHEFIRESCNELDWLFKENEK